MVETCSNPDALSCDYPPLLLQAFQHAFPDQRAPHVTTGPGSTVWVAAAGNGSAVMNLVVPELDAWLAFRLSVPGQPACRTDVIGTPLPPWALYICAVGWAWAAAGHTVPGLDAVIHSVRGVGAGFVWETGLSFAAVWQDLGGWPLPAGGLLGLMTRVRGYFHG
ncbi:MAG: hypothetical protein Kow0077_21940 [Anaerolineae bacterium]